MTSLASTDNPNQKDEKRNSNCWRVDCDCGPNCKCTETLCQCQASSLLNSLCLSNLASSSSIQFPLKAEWSIVMTCKNCAEMAQKILGDSAVVALATNLASVGVKSNQEAKELTEALQDVGLDATLLSVSNFLDAASSRVSKNEVTKVDTSPTITPNSKKRRARRTAVSSLMATDDNCGIYDSNGSNPVAFASQEDPLLISPIISSKPTTRQVEVMIGGMTCTMCSRAITQTLQKLSGIDNVQVNLATGFGSMTVIEGSPSTPQVIIDTIESIGYTAREVSHSDSSPPSVQEWQETQQADARHKQRSFLFSLIGTVPISFLTMILPNFNKDLLHITVMINGHTFLIESIILAGLGTIVQFGSGWSFYKNSHNNILSGQLGMDVLVAVGTTASYFYAWIQTWNGEEAHAFETSAVLISFVLLGKWLNSLAVRRTSEALTHLLQLQSKTAILVSPDGAEKIVDVDQIQPGSFVRILRGASLPADGVVSSGELTVDESMMTGETMPILKTPGSLVLGGTVCQESDGALIKVTGVGSETALSQIVKLVQEAQTKQVPIQDLADSISSIFVPTVCTLAILTFLIWYALCNTGVVPQEWYEDEGDAKFSLMFGIACLVISCPCALGLATPTAVMVGTGVAARYGVLMKGGETLEMASKVDSIVFDKTGTLTLNKPAITDFIKIQGTTFDRDYLLWLFASLERNSEHPLATAVVAYAENQLDATYLLERPLQSPSDFIAKTGRGAMGKIDNCLVAIGNRPFLKTLTNISVEVEQAMIALEQEGKTAILAAVNNEVQVVMGIADELKNDAASTLRYLQERMNIEVWMVTGDNSRTARAIAQKLGLAQHHVISEALPMEKVRQVKKLQSEGKVVCMVGDGINDSAAMAQANVGISLATGAQIAIEAADMVLVRQNQLQEVVTALDLSQVIFRRIQLNFVFSLVYNCLGIPVAAGALYPILQVRLPPTLAAVAMALSSLSVISSSLALRLYKPPNLESEPSIFQRVIEVWGNSSTLSPYLEAADSTVREPLLSRDERIVDEV